MDFKVFFLLLLALILGSLGIAIHQGWIPSPNSLMRAYAAKKVMNEVTSKVDLKKMMIAPATAMTGGAAASAASK